MIQRAPGVRIRNVEPRAAEGEEDLVAIGCRCVEKTAEASKSAASVDERERSSRYVIRGGIAARNACVS